MAATEPCWLVSGGHVLASGERATNRRTRATGLLGRSGVDGAFVIAPCRSVHTVGMKFDIDVAFLDGEGVVLQVRRMRRNRLGAPVWRARSVIEAEAGAFERWGLHLGDTIEVRT